MSAANPLLKDGPMPQPRPHKPSMEVILASIRQIIADDQALTASHEGPRGEASRPDSNGEAFEPASRPGAGRPLVSNGADSSVRAAFNTLLASRFVQHSDVIIGLTRARCCVPCSKLGLTTICRSSWNVLSALRSSGLRAANRQGSKPAAGPLPYGYLLVSAAPTS